MSREIRCGFCKEVLERLLACANCKRTWYCSKEHQKRDWKRHKMNCRQTTNEASCENHNGNLRQDDDLTTRRDLEEEADVKKVEKGSPGSQIKEEITKQVENGYHHSSFSQMSQKLSTIPVSVSMEKIMNYIVSCLEQHGLCVLDQFLKSKGEGILSEVEDLYQEGNFCDGKTVIELGNGSSQDIRGDQITWVDGCETGCSNIRFFINTLDSLVTKCNGKMRNCTVNGRTKAMVACYPGGGSGYVKHVDNPNEDGRCITCIYYLNKNWDEKVDGGLLKIYPEGSNKVASIAPIYDRLIFFWSDRRNPHEVLPAYKSRYAITIWYLDSRQQRNK